MLNRVFRVSIDVLYLVSKIVIIIIWILLEQVEQVVESLVHIFGISVTIRSTEQAEGHYGWWHVGQVGVENDLLDDLCQKLWTVNA